MAKRKSPRIARVLRRMDGPAAALQSPVVSLPGCAGAHLSVGPGSVLGERVVVARNCSAVVSIQLLLRVVLFSHLGPCKYSLQLQAPNWKMVDLKKNPDDCDACTSTQQDLLEISE
jgi:hypothetical protein